MSLCNIRTPLSRQFILINFIIMQNNQNTHIRSIIYENLAFRPLLSKTSIELNLPHGVAPSLFALHRFPSYFCYVGLVFWKAEARPNFGNIFLGPFSTLFPLCAEEINGNTGLSGLVMRNFKVCRVIFCTAPKTRAVSV